MRQVLITGIKTSFKSGDVREGDTGEGDDDKDD